MERRGWYGNEPSWHAGTRLCPSGLKKKSKKRSDSPTHVHDNDVLDVLNGREAVGNHHDRAARADQVQRLLHDCRWIDSQRDRLRNINWGCMPQSSQGSRFLFSLPPRALHHAHLFPTRRRARSWARRGGAPVCAERWGKHGRQTKGKDLSGGLTTHLLL